MAQAQLAWEKTEIELNPAIGADAADATFKYENKGAKPVNIKAVRDLVRLHHDCREKE